MRHLRMAVSCLVAAFALAAMASSSAIAATSCPKGQVLYGSTCETEKEHASFQAFRFCPFNTEATACPWAQSSAKEKWPSKKLKEEWEETHGGTTPNQISEFTSGKVTVLLKKPITLQGGLQEVEEEGNVKLVWVAAEGAPSITPVAQAGPALTKFVDASKLSGAERERYTFYAKVSKETKTTATVEEAGPASAIVVNLGNLLTGEGEAFGFPVKVKLSNPFLGNNCYVGSDAHPIMTEFTSGSSGGLQGKVGTLTFTNPGTQLEIANNTIVSSTFAVPGVEGCGVEGGADEALNSGIGLPSPTGNSAVLNGTLRQAGAEVVQEVYKGEA